MTRVAKHLKMIPAIYRETALNLLMFGYVMGVRSAIHTTPIRQAVIMFAKDFELTESEYDIDTALTTYNRMQNKHIENLKT